MVGPPAQWWPGRTFQPIDPMPTTISPAVTAVGGSGARPHGISLSAETRP